MAGCVSVWIHYALLTNIARFLIFPLNGTTSCGARNAITKSLFIYVVTFTFY